MIGDNYFCRADDNYFCRAVIEQRARGPPLVGGSAVRSSAVHSLQRPAAIPAASTNHGNGSPRLPSRARLRFQYCPLIRPAGRRSYPRFSNIDVISVRNAESLLEEALETLIAAGAEDFEVQRVRSKLEALKAEQDSADDE